MRDLTCPVTARLRPAEVDRLHRIAATERRTRANVIRLLVLEALEARDRAGQSRPVV